MNTIVISDTAILDYNYQRTKENIELLNYLQSKGIKLIVLSNRPLLCMRKIGAYVKDDKVSYQYLGSCDKVGNGIDFIFLNDREILESIKLKADYTIFGNGICAMDINDNLIYQASYISKEVLESMVKIFRENNYRSYGELVNLQRDSFGDRCFKGREDVYKFFTPTIGTMEISDEVYGMQISARSNEEDNKMIDIIENNIDSIVGYKLNGKPCFYQREVNKLNALIFLMLKYNINIDDAVILLSEVTDDVITSKFNVANLIDEEENIYAHINPTLKRIAN